MHRRVTRGLVRIHTWPVHGSGHVQWRLVGLLGLALLVTSSIVSAGTFSAIIVMGDSLSDTGNAFRATSAAPGPAVPVSPPYFQGHFSNGLMWIEDLATALGLQITPSLAGGTNFAFGGAKTGFDVHALFQHDLGIAIPSLRTQVTAYRATLLDPTLTDPTRIRPAPADALYVVWGGANDLREAIQQGTQGATPAQIASDVVGIPGLALRMKHQQSNRLMSSCHPHVCGCDLPMALAILWWPSRRVTICGRRSSRRRKNG